MKFRRLDGIRQPGWRPAYLRHCRHHPRTGSRGGWRSPTRPSRPGSCSSRCQPGQTCTRIYDTHISTETGIIFNMAVRCSGSGSRTRDKLSDNTENSQIWDLLWCQIWSRLTQGHLEHYGSHSFQGHHGHHGVSMSSMPLWIPRKISRHQK
jgi:hypothetical protein